MTAFPTGRAAALARLGEFRPSRYAGSRNMLDGSVSRLSPYLRHGILDLAEVRDAVLARGLAAGTVEKFLQELGWRDYWRRIYGLIGERIAEDLEPGTSGWSPAEYADELPYDVQTGHTGLACMDAFVHDLVETGYVHNHARMWFASYLIHHRRVRWQHGARFFEAHLLDGDPASNRLSWQWVGGTFSAQPYLFNRENLERYSRGAHCGGCPRANVDCPFEASYDDLRGRLLRAVPDTPRAGLTLKAPADPPPPALDAQRPIIWAHTDALSDANVARRAYPDAPVIFAWDAALREAEPWSFARSAFVEGALAEMRVDVRDEGDAAGALLAFARMHRADAVVMVATPDPGLRAIAARVACDIRVIAIPPPPFSVLDKPTDLRRFSRYWKRAAASASNPTRNASP
jgi:deoxyribodipyrimidine photo-lyase